MLWKRIVSSSFVFVLAGCSSINIDDICSCSNGQKIRTNIFSGSVQQCQVEVEKNHWVSDGNYCEFDKQGRLSVSGKWKGSDAVGEWYQYEYTTWGVKKSPLIIERE